MRSLIKIPVLLLLLLPLLGSCQSGEGSKERPAIKANLSVAEFEAKIQEPEVVVLDTRTTYEYNAGHLEGAVLIDLGKPGVIEQLQALDKGKTYMLYCAVGGRSDQVKNKMKELGFENVGHLKGGIQSWERAGKKVVR